MSDIIKLLPDNIANQIAAGEVIQRPASAVKELLENAIDSGATEIKLIIKDAGRTLMQVIDNGSGMSVTDARLAFERHATSKIKEVNDIFQIQTKGFRGEALASIASVAQLELKTKKHEDELGTQINIEASEIKNQEPCSCKNGSSFSVKNLFFNVPARRNFLKSNAVENKHIIEEFQRVALTHPNISFVLNSNGSEVFNLPSSGLRQRIVNVFGKNYNQRLVPVLQETNIVNLSGFVCKPEFAKKTRGEQYFFVNNRFIKSTYLSHAVSGAFQDLLHEKMHPSYFLYLDVDPTSIDINVHPTKTEIKFEDEKALYAIIRSSVRQSLGKYNVSPTLDFDNEQSFGGSEAFNPNRPIIQPTIDVDPTFNPFNQNSSSSNNSSNSSFGASGSGSTLSGGGNLGSGVKSSPQDWQNLYAISKDQNLFESEGKPTLETNSEEEFEIQVEMESETTENVQNTFSSNWENHEHEHKKVPYQIQKKYVLSPIKSGFILIHQSRAHQRILYEGIITSMAQNTVSSQQLLFPEQIELSPQDFALFSEIKADFEALGFSIAEFSNNCIAISGIPSDATEGNTQELIESLLEECKNMSNMGSLAKKDAMAKHLSKKIAIKTGQILSVEEMQYIIDNLFACESPYLSPDGNNTIANFTSEEIEKKF